MFEIRTMTRDEVNNFAVIYAAFEGWNPGINDASPFYAADPDGFLIGLLDGNPIACISAVSYNNRFGFLGFYIVIPEYRHEGYGIQMWNAAVKKLEGQNMALDGVFQEQHKYEKSGFKFAYSNLRYEYTPDKNILFETYPEICTAKETPFQKIEQYDLMCFPEARGRFLSKWLQMPYSHNACWIENGEVKGYSVIRKCVTGFKIGPLFADNETIAEKIFIHLVNKTGNKEKVYLDVPEVNLPGVALAEKYKMVKVFGTARMYTGKEPDLLLNKVFGVTTFELG